MTGTNNILVGDLVRIVAPNQRDPLPNSLTAVVFSQIDEDWFRVYISWVDSDNETASRVQDFPRWMLRKAIKKQQKPR